MSPEMSSAGMTMVVRIARLDINDGLRTGVNDFRGVLILQRFQLLLRETIYFLKDASLFEIFINVLPFVFVHAIPSCSSIDLFVSLPTGTIFRLQALSLPAAL